MVGRKREIKQLRDAYESLNSEFVTLYGRRRIGKTYLDSEVFENRFAFHVSGVKSSLAILRRGAKFAE